MSEQVWFTTKELAERLRLTPKTIYNWRVAGTGPKFRMFEGSVRYALADVEHYEAGRMAGV